MKHLTTKSEQKFQKVMHEFGQGELKSHGEPVTDQRQALAIAYKAAREVYPNYGMKMSGGEIKDIAEEGVFYLDAIEGKEFPGYTFGDDWNGFEVPYFERPSANRIMEALGGTYKDGKYLFDDGYGGEEEYPKQTINTVDGPKEVFAIGAYSWVWSSPEKKSFKFYFKDQPSFTLQADSEEAADEMYRTLTTEEAAALGINSELYEGVEPEKIEEVPGIMKNGGGITPARAAELARIYEKGTAKQLWEFWNPKERAHFIIDHAGQFFELMGDDYNKSSQAFIILTYDTLPSPIRKELIIHHAMGLYKEGGPITPQQIIEDTTRNEPLEYKYSIIRKWSDGIPSDADIESVLDALIKSDISDKKLHVKEGKGKYPERLDSHTDDIFNKIQKNYSGNLKGNQPYSIIRTMVDRATRFNDNIIEQYENKKSNSSMANGGEVSDKLNELYKKYAAKDYWGTKAVKENKLKEWELALSKGDKNAEKFTRQDIIDTYEKMDRAGFDHMVNKIKTRIDEKNAKELKSGIRYDQKLSQDIYELFTGKSLKGMNNKQLAEYFDQTYGTSMSGGGAVGEGNIPKKLSPAKKRLLDRINTLTEALANAGAAAQKSIQKKIDILQKQFDYNPSAKERAMANKGKFAMDVPVKYSKSIYKKLWNMKIKPRVLELKGVASIVVNSQLNLEKAYQVYSDMLKEKGEKVPDLSKISRKL